MLMSEYHRVFWVSDPRQDEMDFHSHTAECPRRLKYGIRNL